MINNTRIISLVFIFRSDENISHQMLQKQINGFITIVTAIYYSNFSILLDLVSVSPEMCTQTPSYKPGRCRGYTQPWLYLILGVFTLHMPWFGQCLINCLKVWLLWDTRCAGLKTIMDIYWNCSSTLYKSYVHILSNERLFLNG